MYSPRFIKGELRQGLDSPGVKKQSLWVEMPDGNRYNIWDISQESSRDNDVLAAIRHAFFAGMEAFKMLVYAQADNTGSRWVGKWEEDK